MIYATVLTVIVMSAQGPVMENGHEYPDWKSCVAAERTMQERIRQARRNPPANFYPTHTADGKYVPKPQFVKPKTWVEAYCHAK